MAKDRGTRFANQARAGWKVREWCADVSIGKATMYALPPEMQPFSVKVGRSRIITESPSAWLARIGRAQRAAA